jgi:hypothetical protein
MTYYEQLVKHVERSMNQHPGSTVVMDSNTFKVVATGKSAGTLARRMKRAKPLTGIPVVFQHINDNAVWILTQRIP